MKLLEPEYQGVKVLYLLTTQPGVLLTAKTPVHKVADMKGMRVRFASVTIKSFIAALGATPIGIPPSGIADALQKGTVDGVFTDYGGAHTAFRLGGLVKYSTDIYAYVSSFGVVMNPASYAKLPPDLQKLIDDTTRTRLAEIGKLWDSADAPGKKYLVSEGDAPITLSKEEDALFKKIGAEDTAKVLADARQERQAGQQDACRDEGGGGQIFQDVVLVLEDMNDAPGIRRLVALITRCAGYGAALFLAAMMLITVADVSSRALFNKPIAGTYDLVQLFLVGAVFFSLPDVFMRGENIVIDFIDHLSTPRTVDVLKLVANLLAFVFLAVLLWHMVPPALDSAALS